MSLFDTLVPAFSRSVARQNGQGNSDLGPTQKPRYEIKETADAYGVTVFLPGVPKGGVEITAESTEVRIVGRRSWKQPEGWTCLYHESDDVPYELVLTHDGAIETEKVAAELRDGVLRVSLPKAEAVKPRKVTVN
jgi:HSP20 family molecular chaperone IbpA